MKFPMLLLILPLVIGFGVFNLSFSNYKSPAYVKMASEMRNEAGVELAKKYNMELIGTGGSMPDKVSILSLSVNINGPKSKKELEKILIESVETFISSINQMKKLENISLITHSLIKILKLQFL